MEDHHRFPIGDSRSHMMHGSCSCNPYFADGVFYHHAFDGREIVIQAEIILGIRCENCLEYIDEAGNHIGDPPEYLEGDPEDYPQSI